MTRWSTAGGGGVCTVRLIEPLPLRACASLMVKGNDFAPGVVTRETVGVKVKTLSPAVVSPPLMPSLKNCWFTAPPIDVRSAVTVRPVLAGFVPGVPVTVNTVDAPGNTEFGLAAPTPAGVVERGARR